MKFFNFSNSRLFAVLAVIVPLSTWAQSGEYSPYSRFGIGTIQPGTMSNHLGMGGLSSPINDPYSINVSNPATYASLIYPTFQIGIRSQFVTQSNQNQSQKLNFSSLNNFNFAFPFGKSRWVLGFGIMPYSRIGYNLVSEDSTDAGMVDFRYTGEGGLNKSYIGIAKGIEIKESEIVYDTTGTPIDTVKKVKHLISIGANFDYFFGSLSRIREVEFNSVDYLNSRFTNSTKLQNPGADIGLHYFTNLVDKKVGSELKKRVNLRVGLTFSPEINLKSTITELGITYRSTNGSDRVVDTSYFAEGLNAITYIPQSYSAGIALEIINSKDNNLTFGLDYKFQEWSKYRVQVNGLTETDPLITDASQLSAGFEYSPKYFANKANQSLLQVMKYRLGYRVASSYLEINGKQLNESAVTAGFTLPLTVSKSASRINFGMEFGTRGDKSPGFVEERFINFQLGIVMTPYFRTPWFVKTHYD